MANIPFRRLESHAITATGTSVLTVLLICMTLCFQSIPAAQNTQFLEQSELKDSRLRLQSMANEAQAPQTTIIGDIAPILCKVYNSSVFPPMIDGNYTLNGSDIWVIEGTLGINGNITLLNSSGLEFKSATAVINGTVWAQDTTTIYAKDSNVTFLLPPAVPTQSPYEYDTPSSFILLESGSSFTFNNTLLKLTRNDPYCPSGKYMPEQALVCFGAMKIFKSSINASGTGSDLSGGKFDIERNLVLHGASNMFLSGTTLGRVSAMNWASGTISGCLVSSLSLRGNSTIQINGTAADELSLDGDSTASLWNSTVASSGDLKTCVHERAILLNQKHVILLQSSVNALGVPLHVKCVLDNGKQIVSEFTSEPIVVSAAYEIITSSNTQTIEDCTVTFSRGSLYKTETLSMTNPLPILVARATFNDKNAPIIGQIETWEIPVGDKTAFRVRTNVQDSGIGVDQVVLKYSIDEGEVWRELPNALYIIDNSTFECTLPPQEPGTTCYFYLTSYDICKNRATSNITTLVVPTRQGDGNAIYLLLFTASAGIFAVTCIYVAISRRKRKIPQTSDGKNLER